MNTAENLFYDPAGALIDALEIAKRRHFMEQVGRGPNAGSAPKCTAVRLPLIHTPRLSWWQCSRLSRLGFPNAQEMVIEMTQASHNADETFALAIEQIVQSSFAPELRNTLQMYLTFEGAPDVYDPKRVSQVYALFTYVSGSEELAAAIEEIVPMTQDLKDMRSRIAMG